MTKQGTNSIPSLWYEDNNMARAAGMPSDFKQKFLKPETWQTAREAMDVYMIRANTLTKKGNEIGCEFGLICTSRKAGYESDRAYHETVLKALERHKSVGGAPDQYLIMSWFPHPLRSIPENAPGR